MPTRQEPFDPRAILAALERNYVDYVVIGGLARVVRGTDEITSGVDICPSFASDNLERLGRAISQLDGRGEGGKAFSATDDTVDSESAAGLTTHAGELKIVGTPAGAPGGFVDLRRAATKEYLGQGLRPLIASTADLARLAAALHRDEDIARLPALRRVVELEVDRQQTLLSPNQAARYRSRRRADRTPRIAP